MNGWECDVHGLAVQYHYLLPSLRSIEITFGRSQLIEVTFGRSQSTSMRGDTPGDLGSPPSGALSC